MQALEDLGGLIVAVAFAFGVYHLAIWMMGGIAKTPPPPPIKRRKR